jgi:hypothetical protein
MAALVPRRDALARYRAPWSPRAWAQALYLAGGVPAQLFALFTVLLPWWSLSTPAWGHLTRQHWGKKWAVCLISLVVVFFALPAFTAIHRHRLRAAAGVVIPPPPPMMPNGLTFQGILTAARAETTWRQVAYHLLAAPALAAAALAALGMWLAGLLSTLEYAYAWKLPAESLLSRGQSASPSLPHLFIPVDVYLTVVGVPVQAPPPDVMTRSVTVPQPVTGLTVDTYGGQVRVTAGPVSRVQITETIMYDPKAGGPPAVAESVSGGRLSLGDPACASSDCSVNFALTVPSDLPATVATQGDPVTISGTGETDVDSAGGPVWATRIGGPFTVSTEGGPLMLTGLAGPLRADTGGGSLTAQWITAATATVTTGGGPAQIAFDAPPQTVAVSTDGGPAMLTVPGGPYALTAESDGGPQWVGIATDPAARPSITVTTGGGPLRIASATLPGNRG